MIAAEAKEWFRKRINHTGTKGVLFVVVMPFMGSIQAEERQKAIIISVVMIVLGAIVSAVFSMAIGASQERRRTAQ